MIERLIRFLKGYVRIDIYNGNVERFLNMLSYRNICIWNITKEEECTYFYINIRDVYRLKQIFRKTKVKFNIKERYGLPFFLFTYRKRKAFFIGFFIGWAIVYVMSLYIWNIDFQGNFKHTDSELYRFLAEIDIKEGIKKEKIDGEIIEKAIRNKYFDITWASVDISGTKLTMHIRENINDFDKDIDNNSEPALNDDKPGDLVSCKEAEIVSIITRNGKPLVKAKDTVKKGDVLISGKYELYKDDMTVLNERNVRADGDVVGKVVYTIDETIPREFVKKVYTGNEFNENNYIIGEYEVDSRINFHNEKDKKYDVYTYNEQLVIGKSFYLPIFNEKIIYREYYLEDDIYSESMIKELASKKLLYKIKKIEENTIQILENNVKIEVDEKMCKIYGQVIVLEYIGVFGGTYE